MSSPHPPKAQRYVHRVPDWAAAAPGGAPWVLRNAARDGEAQLLAAQLELGADVNSADVEGNTALLLASEYGHLACVQQLLSAGADASVRTRYPPPACCGAWTHLLVRARYTPARVLRPMTRWRRWCRCRAGMTPYLVAAMHDHVAVVEALLGVTAGPGVSDPAAVDNWGQDAMTRAVDMDHPRVVETIERLTGQVRQAFALNFAATTQLSALPGARVPSDEMIHSQASCFAGWMLLRCHPRQSSSSLAGPGSFAGSTGKILLVLPTRGPCARADSSTP
jgi:hypothetical protein